jgi:hypothetical protein
MREIRLSGSEGGGAKLIVSPYPYLQEAFSACDLLAANASGLLVSIRVDFHDCADPHLVRQPSPGAPTLTWSNPTPFAQRIVI